LDNQSIGLWLPTLGFRKAPDSRQAGDVELLFDRHRQPEQRPALAACQRRVGGIRGRSRPVEIADDDGVD
jgi:hypothetical protein